jgi:hypothetical protein
MAVLASGAANPHWKWYAEQCGTEPSGYLGFIFAANAQDVQPRPPTDIPASIAFDDVGIAVMNTNLTDATKNVQLHFKSSPWGRQSHGYNSNNAFALSLAGKRVFISSGARDLHGSVHHQKWMWETKSDNAILINGHGQIKHSAAATGRISLFSTSPEVDIVVGEAEHSYKNLDRWTRRMVFLKPDAVVIHDIIKTAEPSAFTWLLHAMDAPFEIDGQTAAWKGEQGVVRVEFLAPAGLEIQQTDKMDPPPADWSNVEWKEYHLAAHAPEKTTRCEFVTVLMLPGTDGKAKYDAQAKAVTVPANSGTKTVQLGDEVRVN